MYISQKGDFTKSDLRSSRVDKNALWEFKNIFHSFTLMSERFFQF